MKFRQVTGKMKVTVFPEKHFSNDPKEGSCYCMREKSSFKRNGQNRESVIIAGKGEELLVHLPAFVNIRMEIDLGGFYRGVTKVLLDDPEVL